MKKIKIKIAGWIGILLWIMVLAQVMVTKGFEKEMSIMEAFSTGEQVTLENCSSEIIGRTDADVSEADRIINEIMECNGCTGYEITDISESLGVNGVCKRAVSVNDNYKTTITVTRYDKAVNTYVHYKIEGKNENNDKAGKAIDYFNSNDIECAVYSKVCGTTDGLMSEEESRKYAEVLFERLGVVMKDEHCDKDYIAYGYGASLPDAVISGDKKINVQVMLCNNEIEGKTEISVGTPILLD